MMRSRIAITVLAAFTATALVGTAVSAEAGGRIVLDEEPARTIDTRLAVGAQSGKVSTIGVGSGVLQVWALNPDEVGTAVIHPCNEAAPTDRSTFRLDPADPIQYSRVFTADPTCLTSTTPIHVIVDEGGTVAAAAEETLDQYVALAAPIELSTQAVSNGATLVIERPAQLTAGASAAIVSLDVLGIESPGFVTAYGCNDDIPLLPDLSYSRGRIANVAAVSIEPGEDLCVFARSGVTLRTTLLGEIRNDGPTPDALPPSWSFVDGPVPAPGLRSINPVRQLDTRAGIGRNGTGRQPANETIELSFAGLVRPGTTAVSMNVTATDATGDGFLTVWPCGGDRPEVSNLNFTSDGAVPNLVVTKLSPQGTACISVSSDAHVLADVNGTYEADGALNAMPVEPVRILDTRAALGTPSRGRVEAGNELVLQVTGGDVPPDAGAATLNVTAAGSDASGFVTVYPCGSDRPTTSNLNFRAGEASPNLVTTALSPTGTVCLFASESVHLIADLAAWYGLDQPAGLVDLAPTRVLDTRQAIGVATAAQATPSRVVELDFALSPDALSPDVAADADAVVMNVTVAQADDIGFVTAWPCDQTQPTVSNLNIRPGRTVANLTTVKLSATGTVCLATTTSTHLIADVAGYLTDVPVDGDALVLGP